MSAKINLIKKSLSLVLLLFISVTFLMGDFCADVFSIPVKVDYTTEEIELTVDFSKMITPDIDGDYDLPDDGDYDIPVDGGDYDSEFGQDFEISFDENGYRLNIQHQVVDFVKDNPEIAKYKSNLEGIFIRLVSYEIVENIIPSDIPDMEIYLSPLTQPDEDSADDTQTLDWDQTIADNPDLAGWNLPDDGKGDGGMVKLGTTDPIIFGLVAKDVATSENLLTRQTANLDLISETILSKFKFQVIIKPKDNVYISSENQDKIPDDLIGRIKLKLHFVIVIVVKA